MQYLERGEIIFDDHLYFVILCVLFGGGGGGLPRATAKFQWLDRL